jgi:serine protease Do
MRCFRSLLALVFLVASVNTTPAETSVYSVAGLALGSRVHVDSRAYQEYDCNPSEQFNGFTWCTKKKNESERRGDFKAYYSILHSSDGTAYYINRFQEPAFWDDNEINEDIARYSRKVGAEPKILNIPRRSGFPDGTIAVWGNLVLEPLDNDSRKILAADKNVKRGILVDFLGNYTRSAREGLPLYRITGGTGFVWIASNKAGRGTLRFLAINPSAFYPAENQPSLSSPPQSRLPDKEYARIGWWTIAHRVVGSMNGCDATAHFQDQTHFQMSLIQSASSEKEWAIFIANPRWNNWIAKKRQHLLRFAADDALWYLQFSANDQNALSVFGVLTNLINSVADADGLKILTENYGPLTSLDMKDSRAAIQAVVDCVREHPPAIATQRPAPTPLTPEPATTLSGTAFFVTPNRLVTNNHVVNDCTRQIEIKFSDQAPHPAYIDAQDDVNDLALLHSDMTSTSFASFRPRPRVGERVATYGFPYSGILSRSGNFTLGDVSASTGLRDDSRLLQVTTPIQPGNSGGPLLDMSGNVVGIVTAQLSAFAMIPSGSIPQNVNFAIGSSIITNFLSAKGLSPQFASDAKEKRELAPADVADKAKEFTVQIYCKGVSRTSSNRVDESASSGWSMH